MHQFLKGGVPALNWALGTGCEHPNGPDESDPTHRRLMIAPDPSLLVNAKAVRPPMPGPGEPLMSAITIDGAAPVRAIASGLPSRGVELYVPLGASTNWDTVWEWDPAVWTYIPPA